MINKKDVIYILFIYKNTSGKIIKTNLTKLFFIKYKEYENININDFIKNFFYYCKLYELIDYKYIKKIIIKTIDKKIIINNKDIAKYIKFGRQ